MMNIKLQTPPTDNMVTEAARDQDEETQAWLLGKASDETVRLTLVMRISSDQTENIRYVQFALCPHLLEKENRRWEF